MKRFRNGSVCAVLMGLTLAMPMMLLNVAQAASVIGQRNSLLTLGTDYRNTAQFQVSPGEQTRIVVGLKDAMGTSITNTRVGPVIFYFKDSSLNNVSSGSMTRFDTAALGKWAITTSATLTTSAAITASAMYFTVVATSTTQNLKLIFGPAKIIVPNSEVPY